MKTCVGCKARQPLFLDALKQKRETQCVWGLLLTLLLVLFYLHRREAVELHPHTLPFISLCKMFFT